MTQSTTAPAPAPSAAQAPDLTAAEAAQYLRTGQLDAAAYLGALAGRRDWAEQLGIPVLDEDGFRKLLETGAA